VSLEKLRVLMWKLVEVVTIIKGMTVKARVSFAHLDKLRKAAVTNF
jgi:hypothetical protein